MTKKSPRASGARLETLLMMNPSSAFLHLITMQNLRRVQTGGINHTCTLHSYYWI